MKKKEEIFKEITDYYEKNLSMPTIRYLMNKFGYHSTNIVYKYLKKLEEEQYLVRNINNMLVLNKKYTTNIKEIPIVNSKEKIKVILILLLFTIFFFIKLFFKIIIIIKIIIFTN